MSVIVANLEIQVSYQMPFLASNMEKAKTTWSWIWETMKQEQILQVLKLQKED